jgi:predicted DNA-binding WGR domain protein
MPTRRFEFTEGRSRKFWQIAVNACEVTVCFGRIGTAGQTQRKSFDSSAGATRHAEKLIASKVKKGYQEVVCS